jgi:two-component sensor histidine kinase
VKRSKTIACLVMVVLYSHQLFAQNPINRNLNIASGFVSNSVYDIYQGKNGIVWIATDAGLVCHKGSSYNLLVSANTSSKSVSNIMEASDGTIWCQNFAGQFYFVRGDSLNELTKLPRPGNYFVAAILAGQVLTYFTGKEVVQYNIGKKIYRTIALSSTYYRPFTTHSSDVFKLFEPEVDIEASIDANGKYASKKAPCNIEANAFFATVCANKNLYVNKTLPRIACYGAQSKVTSIEELLSDRLLNNVRNIGNDQIAIMTSSGFNILNSTLTPSENYFPDDNTSCILKDFEGNLWVGTLNNGLYIIPRMSSKVYLQGVNLTCIAKSQTQIITGSDKNELFFFDKFSLKALPSIKDKVSHTIKSIHVNPATQDIYFANFQINKIAAGTNNRSYVDVSVNSITNIDSMHLLLSESSCLSIYPITKNDKWLTWQGDTTRKIAQSRLVLNCSDLSRAYNSIIVQDTIYSATAKGLFLFHKNGSKEILYKNATINALQIYDIGDRIIFGTNANGVLQYKSGKVSPFIYNDTLNSKQQLYSLKVFDDKIFVLLYSGIDVFTLSGKFIERFVRSDGFFNYDLSDFVVEANNIIASTTTGLITFSLDTADLIRRVPKLLITNFYANQKERKLTNNIPLGSNEKFIEITVEDLDFIGDGSNKHYYSINDGDWIPFTGSKLTFNELPSGNYTVRFKAVSERGITSASTTTVNFNIATPFYKTWWFIATITLAILGLMLLAFRYRIKQIQARNKLEKDKLNLEKALHKSTLSSIKSQMNPHFLFNALNTIQSFIYLNDKKSAADYLVKFSELTRMILENSNREKIDLTEEFTALSLYLSLEKMRFEEEFEYKINTNNISHGRAKIPSMLVQPYVENAIKHGLMHKPGLKKLDLTFEVKDEKIIVTIEDNGIGIAASQEINKQRNRSHTSFATTANQKRLELLNEMNENNIAVQFISLTNAMNQASGTKVIITLPVA